MLLAEKFMLLLINEKKEKIPGGWAFGGKPIAAGIIVMSIMDLVFKEKIILEKTGRKKAIIKIIDASPTGYNFLDTIFTKIKEFEKEKNVAKIVRKFSKKESIDIINALFTQLDEQQIIKIESPMKMGRSGRQVLEKPEIKRKVMQEIQSVVIENKEPDGELLSLICILAIYSRKHIIAFHYLAFAKEYRKQAWKYFKILMKDLKSDKLRELIAKIAPSIATVQFMNLFNALNQLNAALGQLFAQMGAISR